MKGSLQKSSKYVNHCLKKNIYILNECEIQDPTTAQSKSQFGDFIKRKKKKKASANWEMQWKVEIKGHLADISEETCPLHKLDIWYVCKLDHTDRWL